MKTLTLAALALPLLCAASFADPAPATSSAPVTAPAATPPDTSKPCVDLQAQRTKYDATHNPLYKIRLKHILTQMKSLNCPQLAETPSSAPGTTGAQKNP